MKPGERRHRITILRRMVTGTGMVGDEIVASRPMVGRWAKIETLSAREMLIAGANELDTTHRITFPYVREMTTADAIQHKGRTFEIESLIDVDEKHIEHVAICHELSAD